MKTLALFLICLFSIVLSKEWYISQFRGDDSNSGTKLKPLQTLTKAVTLAGDGDSIKIEIGVYKQNIGIKTSLKLIGIPEQNSIPLLSGKITFTSQDISISNLNVESTSDGFVFEKCNTVKVSSVNFGPITGVSMKFSAVKENVDISKILISNSRVIEIAGPTKLVTVSDVVVRNAQGRLDLNTVQNVVMKNVQYRSTPQCSLCSVILYNIGTFMVDKLIIESSGSIGLQIERAVGSIENSSISGIRRTPGQYTTGGGFKIDGNSNVRTKNLDLIDNQSSAGAGFYCASGSLNMNGGKIHRNKALNGAAGECDQQCSFFQIGVDLKDNVQNTPSKCRGL